jgi:phosphatidylglycerol:prolipoprotein diacylglycerol transferase
MSAFWQWWQHIPSGIDPYIFQYRSFHPGWYGAMYLVAFLVVYFLLKHRIRSEGFAYTKEQVQDFMVWAAVGLLAGARLGYVLFYNFSYYAAHPLEIIMPFTFEGGFRFTGIAGMSYHGGLVGVATASAIYFKRHKINFWRFSEFLSPAAPAGYTFGRIGNFINGELYGRPTDVPWGMYFPSDQTGLLRHPSQLYEASLEGVFLFIVLWTLRRKSPFDGFLLGMYLIGYGSVRFFIEFFRQPDPQLGTVLGPFSMGQILCVLLISAGAVILAVRRGKRAA